MESTTKVKCICTVCGKKGFCAYEATIMAYCPTFIKPKQNPKKVLTSNPFKVLKKFHVTKHAKI